MSLRDEIYTFIRFMIAALGVLGFTSLLPATGRAEEALRIGGTGMALDNIEAIGEAYRIAHPDTLVMVAPSLGSSGAIRALLAGAIDLALSARPLTAEETARGATATTYARTPFALFTAASGQAWPLTMTELAEIYRGERTEWPDGRPIRVVLRPQSDSMTVQLRSLSPALDAAVEALYAREHLPVVVTDPEAMEAAEHIPGSLTPMGLVAVLAAGRHLTALPLDGVMPGAESLADGTYPYFITMMAVTGPDPSPAVREFITFLGSAESQAILRRQGAQPLLGSAAGAP